MTRSIEDKLGLKPGLRTRLVNMPADCAGLLAAALVAQGEPADWTLAFCADSVAVARLDLAGYRRGGHLWLAYPKLSSGVATDITRDTGWGPLAALDLLPVTQIAINATWSALRWRYRDEIAKLTRRF